MIKFIHTGDIHLGLQFKNASFPREKAMERRRELWNTFQKIVSYTQENKVDFLLIAGDLYEDAYFTLGDITRVRDILKDAKDVKVIITAGNHDILNTKSLYNKVKWSPNVTILDSNLDKKEFPELDTIVYGYSWNRAEIRENTLFNDFISDSDYSNKILLVHGDINKDSSYLPLSLDKLKELNMSYIALGHIHKPEIFSEGIAYCGSPEPLDFGELGERGIIEGTIENGNTRINFLPFSCRNFYMIDVSIDGSYGYQDILNKIINTEIGNITNDFYRVFLKGYIQRDIDISDLYNDLKDNFYHLEIIDETTPDYDLDILEEQNQDNIIGQFIKTMRQKDIQNPIVKDALYIGLDVLLKGRG